MVRLPAVELPMLCVTAWVMRDVPIVLKNYCSTIAPTARPVLVRKDTKVRQATGRSSHLMQKYLTKISSNS